MREWKFPSEVQGWLSEVEGRKLADLARGKRVVEIGAYQGRSTICMAQTATQVEVIDPCDGRATPSPLPQEQMIELLAANLLAWQVNANVRIWVGTTDEVAPDLDLASYDLVFIDGDHSPAAVQADLAHARRLLAPEGIIAFHDYTTEPGVRDTVDRLLLDGAHLEGLAGSVIALRLKPAESEKPLVFLTMPRSGRWSAFGACRGFDLWASMGRCLVAKGDAVSSVLDDNFNKCLAGALNARKQGATHWAIIHEDVAPDAGWLDVMVRELLKARADVISVAIPIKDEQYLTSTAIESGNLWCPRRLTLTEIYGLPETFGDADLAQLEGTPGFQAPARLLLNTGLWLCDLRRPWVDTIDQEPIEGIPCFQTLSRLVRTPDGEYKAQSRSEDWEWSRELRRRGAVQVVTRAVGLDHVGEMEFSNRRPRGVATDPLFDNPKKECGVCTPTITPSAS